MTVEAITRDAIACLRAGAAIVHTHAPLGDFGLPPEQAAARYFESYRAILAAEPDALLYPTIGGGSTMSERLAHIDILAGAGVLRIGLMDPGSMILGWAGADGAKARLLARNSERYGSGGSLGDEYAVELGHAANELHPGMSRGSLP